MRRRALRSPACRWAATSPSRSCARRQGALRSWRCSIPERGPTRPSRPSGARSLIALAKSGRYAEIPDLAFPIYVHRNRHGDEALKRIVRTMAEDTGARGLFTSAAGDHRPAGFASRPRRDFVPDPRAGRRGRRGDAAGTRRARSPPASPDRAWLRSLTAVTCRRLNSRRQSPKRWSNGCGHDSGRAASVCVNAAPVAKSWLSAEAAKTP